MARARRLLACVATSVLLVACSRVSANGGPIAGTSKTLTVAGEFSPVAIDSVDRVSIEGSRLVLHGATTSTSVELPATADTTQANRGWALVTEGEDAEVRTFTFTHEMSLDDFTLELPASDAPIRYGSFAGRDGHDLLVFAWGAQSKSYWGWVRIQKPPAAAAK